MERGQGADSKRGQRRETWISWERTVPVSTAATPQVQARHPAPEPSQIPPTPAFRLQHHPLSASTPSLTVRLPVPSSSPFPPSNTANFYTLFLFFFWASSSRLLSGGTPTPDIPPDSSRFPSAPSSVGAFALLSSRDQPDEEHSASEIKLKRALFPDPLPPPASNCLPRLAALRPLKSTTTARRRV